MALDCCTWVAKYVFCLFNFIFFLIGSIVLGVGTWLAVDKNSFIALTKLVDIEQLNQFAQPIIIEQTGYILIATGAFMFVISFLGYCGAIRESQCLLSMYGICLVVILITEIVSAGLAAAYKEKAKEETRDFLKSTISNYYARPEKADAITLIWDHLMAQMSCCGVDNYEDFKTSSKWTENNNRTVPTACCMLDGNYSLMIPKDNLCPYQPSDSNSFYEKGCYDTVIQWILQHVNIIIGLGIGLSLVQLFAILLAFCLCKFLG